MIQYNFGIEFQIIAYMSSDFIGKDTARVPDVNVRFQQDGMAQVSFGASKPATRGGYWVEESSSAALCTPGFGSVRPVCAGLSVGAAEAASRRPASRVARLYGTQGIAPAVGIGPGYNVPFSNGVRHDLGDTHQGVNTRAWMLLRSLEIRVQRQGVS